MADRTSMETGSAAPTASGEISRVLPGDVVRALEWLRAHISEPVSLDVLADVAGVRPRTLQSHFRKHLGTTPVGWIRQARLALARRKLLQSNPDDTVTEIALCSGFGQLGRFAAQYRRQFGELPSETLRHVRGAPKAGGDGDDDEAARLTWDAMQAAFTMSPGQCNRALERLGRVEEIAPAYGLAKALAALCWGQRAAQHFASATQDDRLRSVRLARQAAELAPNDALALSAVSGAMVLSHRLDDADHFGDRALALDPWSPFAWIGRGWLSICHGDGDAAVREFRTMLHLMPFEPLRHLAFIGIGCAHFDAGNYQNAARWARSGVKANPGSFWGARVVAAAAAHSGERAVARRIVRNILRKDPDLTVAEVRTAWPCPPGFMNRLAEGLSDAGLPKQ